MLSPNSPALVLAPMEGITDAPMRALQGGLGAFTYAVSEFVRVSQDAIPAKVFLRDIPELRHGGFTVTGLPVQVQLLGGDPEKMAESAVRACNVGAQAIDINFGCPAKTVNRHDGGAALLKCPLRIREIVAAVRSAVRPEIPVSAKLRLGWDSTESIHENAAMAAEGGASWLTIHARTRVQGYLPPVHWNLIGQVRKSLNIPVVANGDIWNLDDFMRCQDVTGCTHFMIGRGALANPSLPGQIASRLGIGRQYVPHELDWYAMLSRLAYFAQTGEESHRGAVVLKLKQWMKLASNHGNFQHFDLLKESQTVEDLLATLMRSVSPLAA